MPQTPFTGLVPYCTNAELCVRYDVRTVAQLLTDVTATPVTVADVPTHAGLLQLLMGSSGKLEAACSVGGRYTPDDLNELLRIIAPATVAGNMAEFIKDIVADLVILKLHRRRPDITIPNLPQSEEVDDLLTALTEGTRIFGTLESMDAGHLDNQEETPADVAHRNEAPWIARRMFGRRARTENRNGNAESWWN